MEAHGALCEVRMRTLAAEAAVRSRAPRGGQSPQWRGWRTGPYRASLRPPPSPGWSPMLGTGRFWLFPVVGPQICHGNPRRSELQGPLGLLYRWEDRARVGKTMSRVPQETGRYLNLRPGVPGIQGHLSTIFQRWL